MNKLIIVALMGVLASGCDENGDNQEYRVLPVTALTVTGDEVPAGTYDEATNVLSFTPGFIETLEQRSGLDSPIDWNTGLEVSTTADSLESRDGYEPKLDGELIDDGPVSSKAESIDGLSIEEEDNDAEGLMSCRYVDCMNFCLGCDGAFNECHDTCNGDCQAV